MKKNKITIIGAGLVGSTIAYAIMMRDLANEIVLIDIDKNKAESEACDLRYNIKEMGKVKIYIGGYKEIEDSQIIIIAAGRSRKAGESRLDMVNDNIMICDKIIDDMKGYYRNKVIIVVSNPVDIMTYRVIKRLGVKNGLILGSGCSLDSSRLRVAIEEYIGLEGREEIEGYVVGEHGESQVILWSQVKIGDELIDEYCKKKGILWGKREREKIEKRVKEMGGKIIRSKGKTNYGIATNVSKIVEGVIKDREIEESVGKYMMGEYGIRDVVISVKCKIDKNGIKAITMGEIETEEKNKIRDSANKLKEEIKKIEDGEKYNERKNS